MILAVGLLKLSGFLRSLLGFRVGRLIASQKGCQGLTILGLQAPALRMGRLAILVGLGCRGPRINLVDVAYIYASQAFA